MISTKTKLVSAIAMLLVATIMMTSASFAWFTISTAPEMANIDLSMAAIQNLEIAAGESAPSEEPQIGDSGDYNTWGGYVDFSGSSELDFPATVASVGLGTVHYADDGRIDDVTPGSLGTANTSGVAYYTATVGTKADAKIAVVYNIWLRSNQTCTVLADVGEGTISGGSTITSDDIKIAMKEASAENWGTMSAGIGLTANVAKHLQVMIYIDGTNVSAADVAANFTYTGFTIKFYSTGVSNGFTPTFTPTGA